MGLLRNKHSPLAGKALAAALTDLAEYGWVLLESMEDARQVQRMFPRPTKLILDGTGTVPKYEVQVIHTTGKETHT